MNEDELGGTCSTYGEVRHAYKILIETPAWKRLMIDVGIEGRTLLK
jgi:hypothetical protein